MSETTKRARTSAEILSDRRPSVVNGSILVTETANYDGSKGHRSNGRFRETRCSDLYKECSVKQSNCSVALRPPERCRAVRGSCDAFSRESERKTLQRSHSTAMNCLGFDIAGLEWSREPADAALPAGGITFSVARSDLFTEGKVFRAKHSTATRFGRSRFVYLSLAARFLPPKRNSSRSRSLVRHAGGE